MKFRKVVDSFIQEALNDGGLPDAQRLLHEVEVPNPQAGPRSGDNPGPKGSSQQATFSDPPPPPVFASASKDKTFPPAKFRDQNSAIPPAIFGSAARVEDDGSSAAVAAVFADLEALQELEDAEEDDDESVSEGAALGRAVRKLASRPSTYIAGTTAGGLVASSHYKQKAKKAAKAGDVAKSKKLMKRSGIAKAVAVGVPTAALGGKAAHKIMAKHGSRIKKASKHIKTAKTLGGKKAATGWKDYRRGHALKGVAKLTAVGAGAGTVGKGVQASHKRSEKRMRRKAELHHAAKEYIRQAAED